MVPFERAMLVTVVSYRLSIVIPLIYPFGRNLPWNVSDAQINRGWVYFGQNSGRKGLTDVRQILRRSGRDMELSYAKEIVSISSAISAQCMNVTDRQTDRSRNSDIDRNRRNRLSAMSRNNKQNNN